MSPSPKKPEIIVTRKKSFEMKRKLRDTAKSMKRISQMTKILKAPINENSDIYNETNEEKKKTKKDDKSKKEQEKKESPKKIKVKQYSNKIKMVVVQPPILIKQELSQTKIKSVDEDVPPEKKKRGRKKKLISIDQIPNNTEVNAAGCKRKMVDNEKDCLKSWKQPKTSSKLPVEVEDQGPCPLLSSELATECPSTDDLKVNTDDQTSDTESLTEEDLLEIVTCESPVWWEDLPHSYCGEATSTKPSRGEIEKIKTEKPKSNNTKTQKPEPETLRVNEFITFDTKFFKKRSKLETLLGNIKNKLDKTCHDNVIQSKISVYDNKHAQIKNIELIKDNKLKADGNTKINEDDTEIKEGDTKINQDDTEIKEGGTKIKQNETEIKQYDNINKHETTEKSQTDSSENDELFYNDDFLNKFANIEIPIEGQDDEVIIIEDENNEKISIDNCEANHNELYVKNNELRNKLNNQNCDRNRSGQRRKRVALRIENKLDIPKPAKNTALVLHCAEMKKSIVGTSPKNNEMRISSIEKESSSPISIKSSTVSDVTSMSSVENIDTISDTGITFIDELGDKNSINHEINEERNSAVEGTVETTQKEISGSSKEISTKTDSPESFSCLKEAYKVLCNKQIKSLDVKEKPLISNKSDVNNENIDNHVNRQSKIYDKLTEQQKKCVVKPNNEINDQKDVKYCDINVGEINIEDNQKKNKADDEIIIQSTSDFDQNKINIEANNERTKINSFYKKCKNSTKRRIKTLPSQVILDEGKVESGIIRTTFNNISIMHNKNIKNIKSRGKNRNIMNPKNINQNTANAKIIQIGQNTSNNAIIRKYYHNTKTTKNTKTDQINIIIDQNTSNAKTAKSVQNAANSNTTELNQNTSYAKTTKIDEINTSLNQNTTNEICINNANTTQIYQNTSHPNTTNIDQINTSSNQNTPHAKTTKIEQNTSKNIEKSDSKLVSDGLAKYCMKCSSIFDTDSCGYCVRKTIKIL